MVNKKTKDFDIKIKKQEVNKKHIILYDKLLDNIEFILDEYSRDLPRADIEFLDMSKNSVSVLDFLISSVGKIQKGQRLALGLDVEEFEDSAPQINILEGLSEQKI